MSTILSFISVIFFIIAAINLIFVERRVMTVEEILMTAIFYILFALYGQNKENNS